MISLQSMKRPPSPLQPERESSWRDFREAASERRKRARRRRLDVAFLAVGCAAAELPAGAAPALLPALAACGATFDGLCLVGVAHHVGVAVAAAVGVTSGRIALGAVAVACAVLAAAPLERTESSTLAATLAVARLIGGFAARAAADGLGARVSAAAAAVTTDADEANTASAARKAALIAAAAPTLGASLAFAIALLFSASRAYDDEITAMGTWRYAWSFFGLIVVAATAALPAPPARPRGASESETLGEPVSPPAAPSPVVTRAAVAAVTLDVGLRCASHVGVVVAAAAWPDDQIRGAAVAAAAYIGAVPLGAAIGAVALRCATARDNRRANATETQRRGRLFRLTLPASPRAGRYGSIPARWRTATELRLAAARRRAACVVAIVFCVAALAVASHASGADAKTAAVLLGAAVAVACGSLPALAVLCGSSNPTASPGSALLRAFPLCIAGLVKSAAASPDAIATAATATATAALRWFPGFAAAALVFALCARHRTPVVGPPSPPRAPRGYVSFPIPQTPAAP